MNSVEIVLVEDSMDDAALAIRALKKNNLANNLLHLQDGQEVLEYLESKDNRAGLKLILLDLKMPKVDGIEVLRHIKSDENLRMIPVVMLTSSREEQDLVETYKLGVNAYIVKPVEFDKFVKAIAEVGMFWLVLNERPPVHAKM